MSVTFTLLGTAGWIPTRRRETTCALLDLPEALFIFDAGTGLSRLLEEEFWSMLKIEREVHLFLSHFHLDHIIGLFYLPAMFRERTVYLHPPAADITGDNPLEVLSTVLSKPFNPQNLDDMPVDIRVEELSAGEHRIAGVAVGVRRQIHADPSAGFRIGDHLVFATDTAMDMGTAKFAAGATLLVHEAWIDGIEEEDPATEKIAREAYVAHTSARQAARLAAEAGVGKLVLNHLNPLRSDDYHRQMLESARDIFPDTMILEDGEALEI
jgi:ribonuclease BN (tRNA processing enzyme)